MHGTLFIITTTTITIQETALPTLLADPPQNMIAQSQSGTGKTAAFVIAMLSRVDTSKDYPQILCLSPTYELAIQTGEVAAKIAQFLPIKLRFAVRGEESMFLIFDLILFYIIKSGNIKFWLWFIACSRSRCKIGRSHHHWYTWKGA